MDETPIPLNPDTEETPAEPPLTVPDHPGPNIFMALVWWLLFMAAQVAISLPAGIALAVIGIAQRGLHGFQAAMQQSGGDLMSVVPSAGTVLFLFATGGNLVVAALIVLILYQSNVRRTMALRRPSALHCGLVILLALPLALVGGELQNLAARVLPHFHSNLKIYEKLAEQPWIVILFLGCLLPALGEELFFRGFLSRGLTAKHGLLLGAIVASSLFGIMHLNPPQAVGTAVLALGFQGVFLSSKSLFTPILLHGLNNAMAFTMLRLANNPITRQVFGIDDNSLLPPELFAASLFAVLGIGWLFFETRTRWILQDGEPWSPGYITAEMPPAHLQAVPRMTSPRLAAIIFASIAYSIFLAVLFWEIWGY